jgi:hypothetical protein
VNGSGSVFFKEVYVLRGCQSMNSTNGEQFDIHNSKEKYSRHCSPFF